MFHERGWLAKCPLHLVDILEKKVDGIVTGSIFDHQVKIVGELLGELAPNWHFLMGREKIINDFNSPTLKKLISWLSTAHKHRNELLNHNILSLREQRYAVDEVGVILDRLNWEVTIPNELINIISTNVHNIEPKIVEYSTNHVVAFTEILKNRNMSVFLSFYKATVALGKEITSYRKLIDVEIEFLKTASTDTPSSWGYSTYSGWVRTNADDWPHYGLQSIYEVAIDILFREWIFPWRSSDSNRKKDNVWFNYCQVATRFSQQGLAVKLSNNDWLPNGMVCVTPYFRPIVKMSFSDDVKEMLDNILCEEAQIHIEELRAWLFAVNQGISPWEAKFEGSSRANLFLSPHDARLVVWPR